MAQSGYALGPPPWLRAESAIIDREVCQDSTCEECGHHGLRFEPWHRSEDRSDVARCVCPNPLCLTAELF
jgi:hypothetical protein